MRPNRHLWLPAFALAACFAARPAHPVCDQTGASTADRDTFAVHGCDVAFFRFSAVAYDQRQGDWQDRGWLDACNLNLEFTKHWNATFLVTFGLADDLLHSWHGTVDYRATAEATNALYHVDIFHTADDDPCCFGSFKPHTFGRDEVSTHCALYDAGATNGNPGSRAGDFMHEGWHAWQRRYHFTGGPCNGHICGPTANCTASTCDPFYFHRVSAYLFGAMWQNDGTGRRFHSPNQVQVEFLCDLSEFPNSWVPASVRTSAAADANFRATTRFTNGPGFQCGDPRPF
ncbi:MAG: hypothetical protein U0002_09530 [Thermoanaerobaculia bacterium]